MPKDNAEETDVQEPSFDEVFDQLSTPGDSNEDPEPLAKPVTDGDESETVVEETAGETDDDDTPESKTVEDAPEEEAAEASKTDDADGDTGEEAAAEEEAQPSRLSDDELIDKLSKAIKPEREEPVQEASKETAQEEEPPVYTADEQEVLDAYMKDFPEVAKAEQLVRRQEYQSMVKYMFTEIAGQLRPMMEELQTLRERSHYAELKSDVQDYDTVRDDVITWVDTQPDYLKDAYNRVINEGTVEQVSDLVARFKSETGWKDPNAPKEQERELPDTAKKAAKSLAPVSSKRSTVPKADDPDDYDGAFAKFADELKT